MKRLLTILGACFLVLVVVVIGFIGFAAYQGHVLDVSSKTYVQENVPPIVSRWSKNELLERSSPQLLKVVNDNPEQFDQLFSKLSSLGTMQSFGDVKGDSLISMTAQNGKVITANYIANAKFKNGDAQIYVQLIQMAGKWQFLTFRVNSPKFLQ
jgi:hypothetical protein